MATAQALSSMSFGNPSLTEMLGTKLDANKGQAIRELSRDFEAMFLSMLLKEMRQTLDPEEGLFPGDTGDVQGGLYDMYLGNYLADQGGIGVAAALEQKLIPGPAPHADGNHNARGSISRAPRS